MSLVSHVTSLVDISTDEYDKWKKHRFSALKGVGTILLSLSEKEIADFFDDFEKYILNNLNDTIVISKLNILTYISVLSYFRSGIDQIKNIVHVITDTISSEILLLSRAATKVLYWISSETPDGVMLLKEPANIALKWLTQNTSKISLEYQYLNFLKHTRKFSENEIIHYFFSCYETFFRLSTSDISSIRILSSKVVKMFLEKTSLILLKDKYIRPLFELCENFIINNDGPRLHGPVRILRYIFLISSDIFTDFYYDIFKAVTKVADSDDEGLSYDSFKLLLELSKHKKFILSNECKVGVLQLLMSKCIVFSKIQFFELLNKLLISFQVKNFSNEFYTFISDNIKKYPEYYCSNLLTLQKLYPNFNFSSSIFLDILPNDYYIQCIQQNPDLLDENMVEYLASLVFNVFDSNNSKDKIILGLKLLGSFPNKLVHLADYSLSLKPVYDTGDVEVRAQMMITLKSLDCEHISDLIINAALYDNTKAVRLAAVQALKPYPSVSVSKNILNILNDPCFKVRREGIRLLIELSTINPLNFKPEIYTYVRFVIESLTSLSDLRLIYKFSSLLPNLCMAPSDTIEQLSPIIIYTCLRFLSLDCNLDVEMPVNSYVNPNSFLANLKEMTSTEPKKYNVFLAHNKKYIDQRDCCLIRTFAALGNLVKPYINDILNAFYKIFSSRTLKPLLIAAAESLSILSTKLEDGLNLRLAFPKMIPVLMRLLLLSSDIIYYILNLLGTSSDFDPNIATYDIYSDDKISKWTNVDLDIDSSSFFIDFVMISLIQTCESPSIALFEALTLMFITNTLEASKFIDKVVPLIIDTVDKVNETYRDHLFTYLNVITSKSPNNIVVFIDHIINICLKYLMYVSCIELCSTLAFNINSPFVESAKMLFNPVLQLFGSNFNLTYQKALSRLLVILITKQKQPLEFYLLRIEYLLHNCNISNQDFLDIIILALTQLTQLIASSLYQSRIGFIIETLLIVIDNKNSLINLIYSAIYYISLPVEVVENLCENLFIKIIDFSNLYLIDRDVILKERITIYPLCNEIPSISPPAKGNYNIFNINDSLQDFNIQKWLHELCDLTILNSPEQSIRNCFKIAKSNNIFRSLIFPISFYSCWKSADFEKRKFFSDIVVKIINQFDGEVDHFFSQIAELLDRAGCPLIIEKSDLVLMADSKPLKLYYNQKIYDENPKNSLILESLMKLNTEMGRNSSASGILVYAEKYLESYTAGSWHQLLGEWDKALEQYRKTNEEIPDIISCLSHLEKWDELIKLEPLYDKLSDVKKSEYSYYFALAFYEVNDLDKSRIYCDRFYNQLSLSEIFFKCIFHLKIRDFHSVEKFLETGFSMLATYSNIYSTVDEYRLREIFSYAAAFVEVKEVLNILVEENNKKFTEDKMKNIIYKRLNGFQRRGEEWLHIYRIRLLLFSPEESLPVFLKMIRTLTKERKWDLINSYFDRLYYDSIHPEVEFASIKIMLATGSKTESIYNLKFLLDLFNVDNIESFKNVMLSIPSKKVSSFLCYFHKNNINFNSYLNDVEHCPSMLMNISNEEKLSIFYSILDSELESIYDLVTSTYNTYNNKQKLISRINRKLALCIMDNGIEDTNDLRYIIDLFEKSKSINSNDYRAWIGWAIANYHLMNKEVNKETFYNNAIKGFLKASELCEASSFVNLCQTFSLFFQPGLLQYLEDIDNLSIPPHIIIRVLPQITVQIANQDQLIKNFVHKILEKFGIEHYQVLYFPLKLYVNSSNKDKSEAAQRILYKIYRNHETVYSDYELFYDAMTRCAILWCEEATIVLDAALGAYKNNNIDEMRTLLKNLFTKFDNPKCDFDRWYIRNFESTIAFSKKLFLKNTKDSLERMWEYLKDLYHQSKNAMLRLDLILISKISEEIEKKTSYSIVIPGTYSINKKSPLLHRIEPCLQVLGTQQHPKSVTMLSSEGKTYKFLLKGNQDLRLDQRVMQFFVLVNSILKTYSTKSDINTQITNYAIIPLSTSAGLISWVNGADTMHQMIRDYRYNNNQSIFAEIDLLNENCGKSSSSINQIQMLEQYYEMINLLPGNEIKNLLWTKSRSAANWIQKVHNFTVTNALMDMVGYIIGLGDRHPSNIMIQRETGSIIHIDFGDSFEVTLTRPQFPEKVPFRLTRIIINALDNSSVEGLFRNVCQEIMYMLRENKDALISQLEIFIHEPLNENTNSIIQTISELEMIKRISSKLSGKDEVFGINTEVSVESQVSILIQVASDPQNYTSHYRGWCFFW